MLNLEQIKKALKPMNLKAVAENVGLPYNTVYRLANSDADPKYSTLKIVSDYLENLTSKD